MRVDIWSDDSGRPVGNTFDLHRVLQLGISGAQATDTFTQALDQAWARTSA
jgi:hypothetical protein